MSFIDDLARKIVGTLKGSQEEQGGLMESVMGLLTNPETGGLEGLVQTFKEKGLGEVISPWVGTGENTTITPDQVENVLDANVLQQPAEKAGISVEDAKAKLSELLPTLIDKLTPEGRIPEGGLLDKGKELLGSLLSKE